MKQTLVYRVTHRETGKQYVGVTTRTLERRWYEHCWAAARVTRRRSKLHNYITKYGNDAFDLEVVATCDSLEIAHALETQLIAEGSLRNVGLNTAPGGEGSGAGELSVNYGRKASPEQRARMSVANSAWERPTGEAHPRWGMKHSDDAKKTMSLRKQGVFDGADNPHYGKHHSDEARAKIAAARAGKSTAPKPVCIYLPDGTHQLVGSLSAFCRLHGIDNSSLSRVARGENKAAKGFQAYFICLLPGSTYDFKGEGVDN